MRTRLRYDAGWGSAGVVAAVEPGAARPLLVASGLDLRGALAGPVRLSGAWRELARPLGNDAGARLYREPTGLLANFALNPGPLRGVQLEPLPGVSVAGFVEPAAAVARGSSTPVVLAVAAAGEPVPSLSVEAYGAVRTAAESAPPARWLLPAPPFPGGELALIGARVRVAAGDGEPAGGGDWSGSVSGSVNVSLGPRLPPAVHARLSARTRLPYGDLAAVVAAAGREFRSLDGDALAAPVTWAVRLSGTGGPRPWRVGYRFGVRGEASSPVLHAALAGAAPHTVELAVKPSVPLGAVTLGGEAAVQSGARGAVPALAVQARARPGTISARWHGAPAGNTLQVRAAAEAAPVAVEAVWRAGSGAITTQLAVEMRLPRGRLRIAAAGLGEPPPKGPRLTVTMSVEP